MKCKIFCFSPSIKNIIVIDSNNDDSNFVPILGLIKIFVHISTESTIFIERKENSTFVWDHCISLMTTTYTNIIKCSQIWNYQELSFKIRFVYSLLTTTHTPTFMCVKGFYMTKMYTFNGPQNRNSHCWVEIIWFFWRILLFVVAPHFVEVIQIGSCCQISLIILIAYKEVNMFEQIQNKLIEIFADNRLVQYGLLLYWIITMHFVYVFVN